MVDDSEDTESSRHKRTEAPMNSQAAGPRVQDLHGHKPDGVQN